MHVGPARRVLRTMCAVLGVVPVLCLLLLVVHLVVLQQDLGQIEKRAEGQVSSPKARHGQKCSQNLICTDLAHTWFLAICNE